MSATALYRVGDVVRRKSAPDKVGVIKERFHSDQTDDWQYKVNFGLPPARQVPESDLEPIPDDVDPWHDLLAGRTEGPSVYHKLLTFERLNRPPSRVAESFGVARAKLLPYQFKPLLKFLDSSTQRLLIADDVGLGKTIEAGYIFKELKAAHGIGQCLVVVPARLRFKWQRELEERFDERFEIVGARDIRTRLIGRLESGRELEPFLWITSYESVRQPDIITGLKEVPAIDLVILDEAHRVRNPETQQNAMARILSECANAMLLLTATPVQTSLENLFQLLRLVDPETFVSFKTFDEQLRANQPVVRALAKVRLRSRAALDAASDDLQTLKQNALTRPLTNEPFFESLLGRLRSVDVSDRQALVELQRDIAELSLTSTSISRTRKVDVLPDRPQRSAQTVRVALTDEERRVYEAVAQQFLHAAAGSWGLTMAMIQALRLTASCIPAAVEYFRNSKQWREVFGADLEPNVDEDSPSVDEIEAAKPRTALNELTVDSKLGAFHRALQQVWAMEGGEGRKVVVFAYFIPTLHYLSKSLAKLGIEHRVIYGGVKMEEREQRIEEFVVDPKIRILLSSEVGSEGVDLQAASVVVNYDLPWNPMVVEQRIGRIDRLGQTSPKLTIVNLVLENTVEDRVLMKLYERIHLFEQTIGEAEQILGETVQDLALGLLRHQLSNEEVAQKAEQAADAFLNQQHQAEVLQDRADQLMAGDQAFLDEVESLIGERRVPSPKELLRFLKVFLDSRYPGCDLPNEVLTKSSHVRLQAQVAFDLINAFPSDQAARRFANRLQLGPINLTMDSDAYMRVGSAEFVSMHHCLIRLACQQLKKDMETLHRTFRLRIPPADGLQPGEYLLQVTEYEVSGIRPRTELRPLAVRLGERSKLPQDMARSLFVKSLDDGQSCELSTRQSVEAMKAAIELLATESDKERARLQESESTLGALRAARRRATQEGFIRQRVKAVRDRLASLMAQHAQPFSIRMTEAKVRLEQGRLEEFLARTEPDAATVIAARDVAVALIRVEES